LETLVSCEVYSGEVHIHILKKNDQKSEIKILFWWKILNENVILLILSIILNPFQNLKGGEKEREEGREEGERGERGREGKERGGRGEEEKGKREEGRGERGRGKRRREERRRGRKGRGREERKRGRGRGTEE
jgi:hypothetical protein